MYILRDKIVKIDKIIKPIKGVSATLYIIIVVVGDYNGGVGLGKAKGLDQNYIIHKAFSDARKSFHKIPLKNGTIYHEIYGKFASSKVVLFPGKYGYNILAGGCIRYIFEMAGIKSIISKTYGSNNSWNICKAAFNALINLKSPYYISQKRNRTLKDVFN